MTELIFQRFSEAFYPYSLDLDTGLLAIWRTNFDCVFFTALGKAKKVFVVWSSMYFLRQSRGTNECELNDTDYLYQRYLIFKYDVTENSVRNTTHIESYR